MRAEVLTLDLARQLARIRPLRPQGAIALAPGKTLDRLIDAIAACGGGSLPDAFLDEQDALEAALQRSTDGLTEFLTALADQWRTADEAFWIGHTLQADAAALERDVDAALLVLPDRMTANSFELDLAELSASLVALDRTSAGVADPPAHTLAPDQAEATTRVRQQLESVVAEARRSLKRVDRAVKLYSDAAFVLERSREARSRIQASLETLRELESIAAAMLPSLRPDLADAQCLNEPFDRSSYDDMARILKARFEAEDAVVTQLEADVAATLLELGRTGVDPNVRRETSEALSGLVEARTRVRAAIEAEAADAERLRVAREASQAIDGALHETTGLIAALSRQIVDRAWRPSSAPARTEWEATPVVEAASAHRLSADAAMPAELLARALDRLGPGHEHLRSRLRDGLRSLELRNELLDHLLELSEATEQQAISAGSVILGLASARAQVAEQVDRLKAGLGEGGDAMLGAEFDDDDNDVVNARRRAQAMLDEADAVMSSPGWPLLSSVEFFSLPGQSAPIDRQAQDQLVNDACDDAYARLGGAMDALERGSKRWLLQGDAVAIHNELKSVEELIAQRSQDVDSIRPRVQQMVEEIRCAREPTECVLSSPRVSASTASSADRDMADAALSATECVGCDEVAGSS